MGRGGGRGLMQVVCACVSSVEVRIDQCMRQREVLKDVGEQEDVQTIISVQC